MIFEAAIDLSITDNTAYTVLVALKQLGYDALHAVERSAIYRLTLSGDMAPEDVARALLRAEVVYNPNKHRLSYESRATPDGPPVRDEWEAVIADRDDDRTRVRQLLVERFGVRGLERVGLVRVQGEDSAAPQRGRDATVEPGRELGIKRPPRRDALPARDHLLELGVAREGVQNLLEADSCGESNGRS